MTRLETRSRAIVLAIVLLAAPAAVLAVDAPHDTVQCGQCHSSHGASYPNMLGELCEFCHYESGPATAVKTHSSLTTSATYGDWDVDCWSCHNPHVQEQDNAYATSYGMFLKVDLDADIKEIDPGAPGPYWPALSILRTVTSSSIEHTSNTTFVDGDPQTDDDICQVCHESTSNYDTGPDMNYHTDYGSDSQPGGVCTSCHDHNDGFGAAAAGGCTGCHASPQGTGNYRRQIVGVGGDFERLSHHVSDGTTTEIVDDPDCEVCHDQSSHQSISEPDVKLLDADDGVTSYTFDGTGASLETFCLACHDSDSSQAFDADGNSGNGYQPFVDGKTPPDIATGWAGSSHNAALVAEACMSCHGGPDSTTAPQPYDRNAHGSDFALLMSASVAGETAANGGEGVCFACHDGAPASTDIEPMFAGTELFESASGALLNTHHDVSDASQAYSGAVMECYDCHDPHAATPGNKLIADPDPNDGVNPTAGNTWAGSSWLSEWCLDCHDNSFPTSITAPTNEMVDLKTEFTGDQHGGADASSGVVLQGGYLHGDILDCDVCHNPGHGDETGSGTYPNIANLRAIIYEVDGVTPLIPDVSWDSGNPEIVRVTDLSGNNTDATTNGKAWCSTCHNDPMGGSKSKGCLSGNCHNHSKSSF
jgi:hypothetical protein